MFKSKQRSIVIPQAEHLKLAGTLAFLWGNDQFDPPPIPKDSFTAGVGLHDRGYRYLDTLPIGEADEEAWLAVTKRGILHALPRPDGGYYHENAFDAAGELGYITGTPCADVGDGGGARGEDRRIQGVPGSL